VEVAKALGGSFKLVTLMPKTVGEMTRLPKETQKNGDTNKSFQPITWQVLNQNNQKTAHIAMKTNNT